MTITGNTDALFDEKLGYKVNDTYFTPIHHIDYAYFLQKGWFTFHLSNTRFQFDDSFVVSINLVNVVCVSKTLHLIRKVITIGHSIAL